MMREHDVVDRCRDCGQATAIAVYVDDLDDAGEPRTEVRGERLPHSRADCSTMVALAREEWPTLF